jgi:hypothetical protein
MVPCGLARTEGEKKKNCALWVGKDGGEEEEKWYLEAVGEEEALFL